MKVAFLTTTMFSRNNGPANFAVNLFELFKKGKSDIDITFITENSLNTFGVIHVPTKWSNKFSRMSMLVKSIEYNKVLRDTNFDVNVWNFSIIGCYTIFKNEENIKNVVFVNDQLSLDCNFNISYSYIRYKIFRFFESFSCKRAHSIITNSEVLKRKIVENYKVSEHKVNVLYKGINIPKEDKIKRDWSIDTDNVIKVSFVKTNYIEGGLEMLCSALGKLYHLNFEIIIIGPSKIDNFFNAFENIKINCLGRLNKSELYDKIINTDLFCVPCLSEAFGQANIEALALQIPTIILPTEIQVKLHKSEYCWIPKESNFLSLSDEISELVSSTNLLRKTKAINGRDVVKDKYSIKTSSIIFTDILQNTINEKF